MIAYIELSSRKDPYALYVDLLIAYMHTLILYIPRSFAKGAKTCNVSNAMLDCTMGEQCLTQKRSTPSNVNTIKKVIVPAYAEACVKEYACYATCRLISQ